MNAYFKLRMTRAEFRRWADAPERRAERFEWVEGRVVQMTNVTRDHADIAGNFFFELRRRLDGETWAVYAADFNVETEKFSRTPDVIVEPRSPNRKGRGTDEAIIIVEVLSPSSTKTDFVDKRTEYATLPSLEVYIIASQDEAICWTWQRGGDGTFSADAEEAQGIDASISLRARGISLPLAEIYRGTGVK